MMGGKISLFYALNESQGHSQEGGWYGPNFGHFHQESTKIDLQGHSLSASTPSKYLLGQFLVSKNTLLPPFLATPLMKGITQV